MAQSFLRTRDISLKQSCEKKLSTLITFLFIIFQYLKERNIFYLEPYLKKKKKRKIIIIKCMIQDPVWLSYIYTLQNRSQVYESSDVNINGVGINGSKNNWSLSRYILDTVMLRLLFMRDPRTIIKYIIIEYFHDRNSLK